MGKQLHRLISVSEDGANGTCKHCGPVPTLLSPKGKPCCGIARKAQRSGTKYNHKRRAMKIESYREEFDRLIILQSGLCDICDRQLVQPQMDHDHTSGKVRGLLCFDCNVGLGWFKDSVDSLQNAIRYLGEQ